MYIRKKETESGTVIEFIYEGNCFGFDLEMDYDLKTRRLDDEGYEIIELDDLKSYLFDCYKVHTENYFATFKEYLEGLTIVEKAMMKIKKEDTVMKDYMNWRSHYLSELFDNFHYYFEVYHYVDDEYDIHTPQLNLIGSLPNRFKYCKNTYPLVDYTSKSEQEKEHIMDILNSALQCDVNSYDFFETY